MPRPPRSINRLQLGPIIGHTDATSTRIWIQVFDDPALYTLSIQGVGSFPFVSTEINALEFGTAIAAAHGLRPDRIHTYRIFRRGRFVPGARGKVRTLPDPTSTTDVQFAAISCNSFEVDGAWPRFARFMQDSQPRFLLMMGDQVYIDDDQPDIFKQHFNSRSPLRRQALARKYFLNWSREPLRRVLANVPTYMIWDDHEIRDGWGSFAPDSPTLAERFPRSRKIFERFNAYFEDARDVYWHFQGCHNPVPFPGQDPTLPNYIFAPPFAGQRRAMPYVFRCGRIVVLVIDSRGERDVFRAEYPILGLEQWGFIERVFDSLPPEVDALAIVTPTPIASLDPEGLAQKIFGDRTDDVERFKRGDLDGLVSFKADKGAAAIAGTLLDPIAARITGRQLNLGGFQRGAIDEARDQWAHKFSRPEQAQLIRKAGAALRTNRPCGAPRKLLFLSGDIHVGGIFDITCSDPQFEAISLTSSGISKQAGEDVIIGVFVDDDFRVAAGIRSKLRHVVNTFNYGVVHVFPTGAGARIEGVVAHEGSSLAFGADATFLI